MDWFGYALLAMLVKSAQNFAEKSGQQRLGTWLIAFLIMLTSTIIIAPFVLLTEELPSVNLLFCLAAGMAAGLYLVAKPLRLFALGTGDISEIVPLVSFKSIFSLILAWLVLSEVPSKLGLLGVSLTAVGGYLINFEREQESSLFRKITKPLKKLIRHRAQSLLMVSLVMASVINIFDKMAINNTSPVSPHHVLLTENILVLGGLSVVLVAKKISLNPLRSINSWKMPLIIGLLYSGRNLLLFTSLSQGNVGYVIAVNQLSSLVAVIGGAMFLGETGIKKRLPSAVLMGIGAFLIGYFG